MRVGVCAEDVQQECPDCLRGPGLDPGNMRLPQCDSQTDAERGDDGGRRTSRQLGAPDEFPGPVPRALRLRQNRLPIEIVFDILSKRVGGRITLLWLLAESLERDTVEVSLQGPRELAILRRLTRPYRAGAEDRFFEAAPCLALELVRPLAGQKLVENDSESTRRWP